jgi:uncharacterized membrane-anchored protein
MAYFVLAANVISVIAYSYQVAVVDMILPFIVALVRSLPVGNPALVALIDTVPVPGVVTPLLSFSLIDVIVCASAPTVKVCEFQVVP